MRRRGRWWTMIAAARSSRRWPCCIRPICCASPRIRNSPGRICANWPRKCAKSDRPCLRGAVQHPKIDKVLSQTRAVFQRTAKICGQAERDKVPGKEGAARMEWQNFRRSDNVEDRRGDDFGGVGGGLQLPRRDWRRPSRPWHDHHSGADRLGARHRSPPAHWRRRDDSGGPRAAKAQYSPAPQNQTLPDRRAERSDRPVRFSHSGADGGRLVAGSAGAEGHPVRAAEACPL